MTPTREAFGRAIKKRRAELGLVGRQVAGRLDITVGAYGNTERGLGGASVTLTTLYRFAKALDLTGPELLARAEAEMEDTDTLVNG